MEKKKIFWVIAAVCVLIGLAYFVFPADFIPDVIAFAGWLDDIIVNLLTLTAVAANVLFALGIVPIGKGEPEYARDYEDEYGYYEER